MKNKLHLFLAAGSITMLFACSNESSKPVATQPDPLASHIDSTVRPADDFFLYANGKWFKENPIPPTEQGNGLWTLIQDTINAQVRNICESSAVLKQVEKGSNKQKIGDFFATGMDSVALNTAGLTPLKADFDRINAIQDVGGIIKETAYLHTTLGEPLFRFRVGQDDKISSKNAVFIVQGGLSLPDRNYYFDKDQRTAMVREKFISHLQNMFGILGYDIEKSKLAAVNVMKLETTLAQASRKREDTRDPFKNYNKITFKQLTESTPNLNWGEFMTNIGLQNVDTVIVGQPEFLKALNTALKATPLDDWKDYLRFQLLRGAAPYLDDKTYLESFNFYSTVLRGVESPKPRWERVVRQTDRSLGELIGQVYVTEYLPKGTKEKLEEIGNAIKAEFSHRINSLDWMSDATKIKAQEKLATIIMKVGYPDKWKDMSSLQIDRSSYVHNVMNANKWDYDYMLAKYGKPVDRTEWEMTPQTYNAYYNPSNNEIVVPGCNIIVPGFERKLADDAILYSIIGGSTFGHEITHGFDDQGAKYDANGNLHNWWTPDDSIKFYAKTKMIVRQFDNYITVDSLHINGELTQGENIADLGGIMMGYEVFKKTDQYKNKEIIAGLTPDQRFFLGYAYAWMINQRPESIASQVKSNEHSPAKFRVIGPLSDMSEFYAVYGVKEGDKMWLPDSLRVKIW
ncbi:MAG: M13 family peptidase [Bacteroidetes bacterium]|nr:M13 family peptidase [Bacteroidota bacterium]